MTHDYVHLETQGKEIGWEMRSYSAFESTFEHEGREVLLVEVEAGGCSFCDGSYAQSLMGVNVEGYVVKWKYKENDEGRSLSLIESVRDSNKRKEIADILKPKYSRSQINFC